MICTFLASFVVICLASSMKLTTNIMNALVTMSGLFSNFASVFFKSVVSGARDGVKGTGP